MKGSGETHNGSRELTFWCVFIQKGIEFVTVYDSLCSKKMEKYRKNKSKKERLQQKRKILESKSYSTFSFRLCRHLIILTIVTAAAIYNISYKKES